MASRRGCWRTVVIKNGGEKPCDSVLSIISVDNKNLDASFLIIIRSETCLFNFSYRFFLESLSKSSISCKRSIIPGKAAPPYELNLLGAKMAFLEYGRSTYNISLIILVS